MDEAEPTADQILIYRDGAMDLHVRLDGQTVWLSQRGLADLYQVTVPTVNEHLANIYAEQELDSTATIRNFRIVQLEGSRAVSRNVEHYSLEAILAVGYRVRSPRGTQFRQWATERLAELLVKGFTLDDERIAAGRTIGQDYFEELQSASAPSGRRSDFSTSRSPTSTQPASTMILLPREADHFSRLSRTSFTGRFTVTQQLRSSGSALMRTRRIWA